MAGGEAGRGGRFTDLPGFGEPGGAFVFDTRPRNVDPNEIKAVSPRRAPGIFGSLFKGKNAGPVFFRDTPSAAPTAPGLAAPPSVPVAAALAPTGPPPAAAPSPIAAAIVGAINRSSGDTGSAALNRSAVERAGRAGTSREDLVTTVDNSRQRSRAQGIVGGRPLGGLANIGAQATINDARGGNKGTSTTDLSLLDRGRLQ